MLNNQDKEENDMKKVGLDIDDYLAQHDSPSISKSKPRLSISHHSSEKSPVETE